MTEKPALLVSASLAGEPCRYDGAAKPSNDASALMTVLEEKGLAVVKCCPECAGGLSTPRPPAEIEPGYTADDVLAGRGRVLTQAGDDVTAAYVKGAEVTLTLCRKHHVRLALLKARSPSCGAADVYDGNFSGQLVPGRGVTTALLEKNGIRVMDEEDAGRLIELASRTTN